MAKKKIKLSTKLYCIFVISFLCAVFIYICTSYSTYSQLNTQKSELTAKIEEEEKKKLSLKEKLNLYQTDTYIEKIAREKLGYIKSDEIIYVYKNH